MACLEDLLARHRAIMELVHTWNYYGMVKDIPKRRALVMRASAGEELTRGWHIVERPTSL